MMQTSNRSPRIVDVSWGRLEVEGKAEPYKDAKLFPGGSGEWNWRETGTAHKPGIQIADVQGRCILPALSESETATLVSSVKSLHSRLFRERVRCTPLRSVPL